jgi:hypothetical protein
MKRTWLSATAAVLLTAGWAAAQPAITSGDYRGTPPPPPPAGVPEHPPEDAAASGLVADGLSGAPSYRVWASGDFLVWKLPNISLPSLAATLPVGFLQLSTQDRFQSPAGEPLHPDNTLMHVVPVSIVSAPATDSLNVGEQFGARCTAGVWLGAQECFGLESTLFYINSRNVVFHNTTGNAMLPTDQFLLHFPFSSNVFVVTSGTMTTTMTSGSMTTTTVTTGTTTATTTTTTGPTSVTTTTPTTSALIASFPAFILRQSVANLTATGSTGMWGAQLNARTTWDPDHGWLGSLVGFRYLDYREDLQVANAVRLFLPPEFQDRNELGQSLNTNLPTDLRYTTADAIRTRNQFYGGQVGLNLDMCLGRLIVDTRVLLGLGVMHQTVEIAGATQTASVLDAQGVPTVTSSPGGLLSGPLDQGTHTCNRIAFVPEINLKLGYQILPCLRGYVGYDFLYMTNVVRPGEQTGVSGTGIQATVAGSNQQITFTQPAFRFKDGDAAINGINFGLEFRY